MCHIIYMCSVAGPCFQDSRGMRCYHPRSSFGPADQQENYINQIWSLNQLIIIIFPVKTTPIMILLLQKEFFLSQFDPRSRRSRRVLALGLDHLCWQLHHQVLDHCHIHLHNHHPHSSSLLLSNHHKKITITKRSAIWMRWKEESWKSSRKRNTQV